MSLSVLLSRIRVIYGSGEKKKKQKKVIVSEYPFSEKQKGRLRDLADTYAYEVITIRLTADFEVLWERRYQRDREPERHLSYIMDHYHYGDSLEDRSLEPIILQRKNSDESSMNESTLNLLWERSMNLNVTDYQRVDYGPLLDQFSVPDSTR